MNVPNTDCSAPACTSQDRFHAMFHFGDGGRPPLWEEGIRKEIWDDWCTQGIGPPDEVRRGFSFDHHEIIPLNLHPKPEFKHSPTAGFKQLQQSYRQMGQDRLPDNWKIKAEAWAARDFPVGVTISRGFLLACGVGDWDGLETVLWATYDQPKALERTMELAAELAISLLEFVFERFTPDFALFLEPVASFHAPVLSPRHFLKFSLRHYEKIIRFVTGRGVDIIAVRTWGKSAPLIPAWIEMGVNTLWNDHISRTDTNYVSFRKEFGRGLRLIGGIDSLALSRDRAAIDATLERTVPPLLDQGGYLPMIDDRVRPEVPFQNYRYYREQLTQLVEKG